PKLVRQAENFPAIVSFRGKRQSRRRRRVQLLLPVALYLRGILSCGVLESASDFRYGSLRESYPCRPRTTSLLRANPLRQCQVRAGSAVSFRHHTRTAQRQVTTLS